MNSTNVFWEDFAKVTINEGSALDVAYSSFERHTAEYRQVKALRELFKIAKHYKGYSKTHS